MTDLKDILKESVIEEAANAKFDIDFLGDQKVADKLGKKYKVKIKIRGNSKGPGGSSMNYADVSGPKKNIVKFLKSKDYDMDEEEIKDLFPELYK